MFLLSKDMESFSHSNSNFNLKQLKHFLESKQHNLPNYYMINNYLCNLKYLNKIILTLTHIILIRIIIIIITKISANLAV